MYVARRLLFFFTSQMYKTGLKPSNLKVESVVRDFLCLKAFYQVTHSNSGTPDVTSPLLCFSKRKEKEILKKKSWKFEHFASLFRAPSIHRLETSTPGAKRMHLLTLRRRVAISCLYGFQPPPPNPRCHLRGCSPAATVCCLMEVDFHPR